MASASADAIVERRNAEDRDRVVVVEDADGDADEDDDGAPRAVVVVAVLVDRFPEHCSSFIAACTMVTAETRFVICDQMEEANANFDVNSSSSFTT